MFFSDFKKALLFTVPLPLIFVLVSPISFYLANHTEYPISISALLPMLLLGFLGVAGFLLFWLMVIKNRLWSAALKGILVALAVAAWVQSQLLAWDFGPLDGRGINWTAWANHSYFEILLWAVIIALISYLAFRREKLFQGVTQGIIFLGILTLASSWWTSDYKPKREAGLEIESPFLFHPVNNKIVIILDSFQSDIFGEIAKRWPEDISFLQGFTFYPNTLGGYPTTQAACPLILTGRFYKNDIPIMDWIEKNNIELNIADYLASRGYGVALVSGTEQTLSGIRSPKFNEGVLGEPGLSGRIRSVLLVLDGGVFRTLPIAFKKSFYGEGRWFFARLIKAEKVPPGGHGNDLRFVQAFEANAGVDSDKDEVFRYYHLTGTHPPMQVNEKYEYVKNMSDTRESFMQQSRGVLGLLRRMLQRLKDLQIYKNAEVIVVGDHGSMLFRPEDMLKEQNVDEGPSDIVLASARPLFLYKPATATATASLSYSDAPMHLADVVCILSKNTFPDCVERLAALEKPDTRKRIYFYYNWNEKYHFWDQKYMPPMTKYVVEGDVRDLTAWSNTYIEYSAGTSRRLPKAEPYSLNNVIDFSAAGKSGSYIRRGWSGQEPTHRWTEGARAVIKAELKKQPHNDLTLRLYANAFPSHGKGPQTVGVVVNGKKVAEWQMLDLAWYEATIPAKLITDRLLNIVFEISNPTAPCTVSLSKDCRKLGMDVRKLIVSEKKVVH
ncbi:MAG: sulfatase-like hydrolase/transferase [Smithellaceae bacterium]